MKVRTFSVGIAAVALTAVASLSPALAQNKGTLYAFHTNPGVGGCPGLDWHITVAPDNKLTGFVAWDAGSHMAKLDGEINKDRAFEMAAQEVGGAGRKATVKGTAKGDYINAMINGSGTACDGNNLAIPRVTGGIGGGGG